MSKRGYIYRYQLILKKLKAKPYSTYKELQAYIDNQFDYLQMQDMFPPVNSLPRLLIFTNRDFHEQINIIHTTEYVGHKIMKARSDKAYGIFKILIFVGPIILIL